MNLMEIIKNRRSIRKYEKKEIAPEEMNKMIEAVRWSPSWANTQCCELIVISDKKIREELKATISPKNPATDAIVNAPALFAVCGKLEAAGYYKNAVTTKFGDWFMYDLGIATQNLVLAAQDIGLGTVIVGSFDHDDAKKILNIPKGYEIVTFVCAGYPAQSPKAPKRKDATEFTHYDKF